MNDGSNLSRYNAWLKGDVRVDGFESPWLQDFKSYREEQKGNPQRISAPQTKPQKRTPQPPRYCAVCPNRLNHGNKYGFCQIHLTKNRRRAFELAA